MSAGLLESARNLLNGILDLGRTRFELFSTELREELGRFAAAIVGGLAILIFVAIGLAPGPGSAQAMSWLQDDLAARRLELVERSATQRRALAAHAEPLARKAAAFDRIVGRVREHPVLTALGTGAVVLLSGRRILDLATRALTLYALLRR